MVVVVLGVAVPGPGVGRWWSVFSQQLQRVRSLIVGSRHNGEREPAGPFVLVHRPHAARGPAATRFCRAPGRDFPGAGIPMAADGSREPAGANALLAAMDQEIGGFA